MRLSKTFELHNRPFFKQTAILMLPVILQQLITIGINFLDNLMIGSFGEISISAAAFGNQFYAFFQFICMGLGSGAVVMSSQFWGRKELEPMRVTTAMALRVAAVICAVFTAVSVIRPDAVLRFYTNNPDIIRVGTPYMRLIGVTFLLAGLSSTATYLMRSVGRVNIPLIGSVIAFFLNLFFNWVFIFGKLGAPRLELVGAAVGTVIARAFEFLFVFGFFVLREDRIGFRLRHFALPGGELRKQYVRFSLPVVISDMLLGFSLTLVSVIYGHVSAELSASHSIANSLIQLVTVINMGMAGAAAVIIGNTIGEGDIPRAKREGNTYILLAFLVGLLLIPPLLVIEKHYIGLYAVSDATRSLVHSMLVMNYFILPIISDSYVISKGVLRGGGDTRFLLLADSSCVWFISLPLGALAGFVWKLSPFWVFFFLRLEYPLKGIVCFIRYCTGKWIKEIRAK